MFDKLILSDAYNYTFNSILLKYNYASFAESSVSKGSIA